jgi:hypothetical protein
MNHNKIQIRMPSFKRYKYLIGALESNSLTRALQNEILEDLHDLGDVFDFGGGDHSHYRGIIKCTSYESINIDLKMNQHAF